MQLSLRSVLSGIAVLALLVAVAGPYYSEHQKTYRVLGNGYAHSGWENASLRTGIALTCSGCPTFITNDADSKRIDFLDGQNLPFVAVVHHDDTEVFDFDSEFSKNGLDLGVVHSFRVGESKFKIKYMLKCMDDANILELLSINDEPLDLETGRLIELTVDDRGDYIVKQHLAPNLKRQIFQMRYPSEQDDERIRPVLEWWRETSRALPSGEDAE